MQQKQQRRRRTYNAPKTLRAKALTASSRMRGFRCCADARIALMCRRMSWSPGSCESDVTLERIAGFASSVRIACSSFPVIAVNSSRAACGLCAPRQLMRHARRRTAHAPARAQQQRGHTCAVTAGSPPP